MPRQSRSRASAPAPRAAPAQSRGAHTAAAPASNYAQPHAPMASPPASAAASHAQPSQGPGMMAQMAATAGSVAVGSTIGHGISSMLFGSGGSSHEAAPVQNAAPVQQQSFSGVQCDAQAKDFTKCLDKADLQSCSWYLEQLKACQAAASSFTST